VDERTAPPIPSRYSENGDHPTIRPRHDPTDSRPADRGREDTPRNFARAPKTTVADWPVSDRRGPPVQPHTVARDVPPERRESYRDSYADRDHGDASRSDIARLPPQRCTFAPPYSVSIRFSMYRLGQSGTMLYQEYVPQQGNALACPEAILTFIPLTASFIRFHSSRRVMSIR
jgi:hypothetical protein